MESCCQALKMDPTNVKMLYRKALIFRLKDDYDSSRADIDEAIRLDPGNRRLLRERMLLKEKVKA